MILIFHSHVPPAEAWENKMYSTKFQIICNLILWNTFLSSHEKQKPPAISLPHYTLDPCARFFGPIFFLDTFTIILRAFWPARDGGRKCTAQKSKLFVAWFRATDFLLPKYQNKPACHASPAIHPIPARVPVLQRRARHRRREPLRLPAAVRVPPRCAFCRVTSELLVFSFTGRIAVQLTQDRIR